MSRGARVTLAVGALPIALCVPGVHGPIAAVVAAALAAVLAWHQPLADRALRHRGAALSVVAVTTIAITALLFGANLQARLGPIDDHEIVMRVGPDRELPIEEAVAILVNHVEVGNPPAAHRRYRPSYFVLNFTELVLWGSDAQAWYAARLVLFAIAWALIASLCVLWLGTVVGLLAALGVASMAFIPELWCRLGPAETYAMVGTALYVWGFVRAWRGVGRAASAWLAIGLGAIIAMGSKENFVLLLPTTWFLAARLWRRRRLNLPAILATLAITTFGVWIALVVASMLASAGVDVYERDVSVGSRASLMSGYLRQRIRDPRTWLLAAGIIACLVLAARNRPRPLRAAAPTLLAMGALIALHASQYVFYAGRWPDGTRYDFPGVLAIPAAGLCLAGFATRTLRRSGRPRAARWIRVGLAAGLAAWIAAHGFGRLAAARDHNIAVTSRWSGNLDVIEQRLRAAPQTTVVLETHDVWDYEYVISALRFLQGRGLRNPLFVRVVAYEPGDDPLARRLTEEMQQLQRDGGQGFRPAAELPEGKAFGIGFSADPSADLESLGRLR